MCDCLKTLCEIYDGLRKKGIKCPNEAEFRSYQLLMLMDGETFGQNLREISRLPDEVKLSPFITLAREVGIAFHSKDHYTYFQLLEKATYAHKCLIHKVGFLPSFFTRKLSLLSVSFFLLDSSAPS